MIIDQRANLAIIWEALQMAREDCISEDDNGPNDAHWDDVCLAMAQLGEGLGIDESGEAITTLQSQLAEARERVEIMKGLKK